MVANRAVLRMFTVVLALVLSAALMLGGVAANQELIATDLYCPVTDEETNVQLHQVEYKALKNETSYSVTEAAFYGEKTEFSSATDRLNMVNDAFVSVSDAVEIAPELLYPKGPVVSYGVSHEGTFVVYFKQGLEVERSVMDTIYAEYEAKADAVKLDHVPVSFRYEPLLEVDRAQRRRPVFGGLQVQTTSGSATLSYAGRRGSTRGYVVSGHFAPSVNTQIYQPTVSSNNATGRVSIVGGTYSDASWVPYSNVSPQVYVTSTYFRGVTSYANPSIGMYVYKSGITTGITGGTVTELRSAVSHPNFGWIYNQYLATYNSSPGDSGGPIYTIPGGSNATIRGLHVGRLGDSAIFTPTYGVVNDMSVYPLRTSD